MRNPRNLLTLLLAIAFCVAAFAFAQQPASPDITPSDKSALDKSSADQSGKPQVKINYLNVCTPPEGDQKDLAAAMKRIPLKPGFSGDYEASRGSTTMEKAAPARYVRLRRDFAADSAFATAQYSLSTDDQSMVETLVLRPRDVKEMMALSVEDASSAGVADPLALLTADTPATRVKLERFGKPSIVLSRCPTVDQAAYKPLFDQASELFAAYRSQIGLRTMLAGDIRWLAAAHRKSSSDAAPPRPATGKASSAKSSTAKSSKAKSPPRG